ncbi:HD domain-containing protein [Candidatus Woesearchaeota archaeon]|nr:HD domain-containing protein [Candidatus Woesearchaeota archaeon]
MTGLVDKIRDLVEETCNAETNEFIGGWPHTVSVVKYSKALAEKLGADVETVEIAAYLHDYASIKDAKLTPEHHIHGAEEAEKILSGLNYPKARIDKVKHCIYAHRGSQKIPRETLEADCVANGDAMAHFNAVPELLFLAYTKYAFGIEEGKEWVRAKLERSWNKLTPDAKDIVKEDYAVADKILVQKI